MVTRDTDWPRRCSAADTVEDFLGAVGNGVTAPGDMMIGPDQHQITLVQCAGVILTDIDIEQHLPGQKIGWGVIGEVDFFGFGHGIAGLKTSQRS